MIEKAKIQDIPFVDGLPNPESRPDQARIDWIKRGECMDGAVSATDNGGPLNRPSVEVQKNVKQVQDNVVTMNDKMAEVIDLVNIHSDILDQTDNLDLIETVQRHSDEIETLNFAVVQNSERFDEVDKRSKKNEENIGVPPLHDESDRTVREELEWQKTEMGSYPGFDYNGMPDIDSTGSGMKQRIINNSMAISNHQGRINTLETNWNNSDVGSLTKEVQNLRSEVGPRKDAQLGHNIYERLNTGERELSGVKTDLTAVNDQIGLNTFPRPGAVTLIELVDSNTGKINKNIQDIATHGERILVVEQDIGSDILAGSLKYNQKVMLKDIKDLYTIVGKTNSEGLRYSVVQLETEIGADGTPGTVKNRILLTEQGIRDLNIQIDELNDVLGVGSGSSGSFSERVSELELQMNGDPNGVNDYEKAGVYRIAYEIYNSKPIADAADADLYYRTKDAWVKVGSKDVTLADNVKITSAAGNIVGVKDGKTFVGELTKPLEILSTVEKFKFKDKIQIAVGDQEKDAISGTMVGNKVSLAIGQSDSIVDLKGEIKVNGVMLGDGNVKDLLDSQDGLYYRRKGTWVRSDNEQTPISDLIRNSYDPSGAVLSSYSVVSTTPTSMRFGDFTIPSELSNVSKIITHGLELIQNDSVAMSVDSGRINFGRPAFINDKKIWTDATDAPSDGEYYARRDGVWEKIDPTGTGGGNGVGEAPDDLNYYVRSNFKWIALGSTDVKMSDGISVKWETSVPNNFTGIEYKKADNKISVGGSGADVELLGVVRSFVLGENSEIRQKAGSVISPLIVKDTDGDIFIGDSDANKSIILRATEAPKAQIGTKLVDLWHSDMDAPSDGKNYGRKDGQWAAFEVNRTLDIILNNGFSYKVADASGKLMTVATSGASNLIELGQKDTLMNINSTIRSFKMDNKVVIKSVDATGDVDIIGMNDDIINLGSVTKKLKVKTSELTVNDQKVWTQADDAPSDGAKYARMNGKWEKSYTYGSSAPNSVGAKEGDVYFQFM